MKKILTLTLVGMLLSLAMTACGSSKGGHCDAYGSVNQVENSDLAKFQKSIYRAEDAWRKMVILIEQQQK